MAKYHEASQDFMARLFNRGDASKLAFSSEPPALARKKRRNLRRFLFAVTCESKVALQLRNGQRPKSRGLEASGQHEIAPRTSVVRKTIRSYAGANSPAPATGSRRVECPPLKRRIIVSLRASSRLD